MITLANKTRTAKNALHVAAALFCVSASPVFAQDAASTAAQAAAAQEITRVTLEGDHRDDMDAHFAYAQRALETHDAREAEWAFRQMLEKNPNLDRVKLDLAMVLIPQGKLAEAKQLLMEVKNDNPPPTVVKNINLVLSQVTTLMKPHQITGAVSVGINSDSNANAAPSTGDITLLDTNVPLGAGAGKRHDTHLFAAVNVSHVYRTDLDPKTQTLRWKTDFLNYRTVQDKLASLNLELNTIRTGPELTLLDSGIKLGMFASYSALTLDQHTYLNTPKLDATVEVPITNDLTATSDSSIEYQGYHNAPGITTYTERTGTAYQEMAGLRYVLSDRWLLNGMITLRREEAKQQFDANGKYGVDLGATYIIDPQTFVNATAGYRHSGYDDPDFLTSAKTRVDNEYTAGVTLGHIFILPQYNNQVTLTAGYLYHKVDSNLQNYDYDNHRISTSVSIAF